MANLEKLKEIVKSTVDEYAGELHGISKEIWSHPELAMEEHHAHDTLTKFLETHGFQVERHYLGLETAFMATVGQGTPHIVTICEYDALPDIGHACGHNLIAEVGAGAGLALKAAMEAAANIGKLTVLGTPAEETLGGKIFLIKRGAFQNVDVAMMAHPFPTTTPNPDALAIQNVAVEFRGKASHAAGFPWEGINALDAAVMAYNNISCLRQQMKPNWRVHGIISNGGAKPNIIPEVSSMNYYLRTPTVKELSILKEKAVQCFEAAAKATGCTVAITWMEGSNNLIHNKKLLELYCGNLVKLGVETSSSDLPGGSTDMGDVSHVVPSIHPVFTVGETVYNHSREFTAAAGADKAQKHTLDQAKALAMTALDVMCQPKLLDIIKDNFRTDIAAEN